MKEKAIVLQREKRMHGLKDQSYPQLIKQEKKQLINKLNKKQKMILHSDKTWDKQSINKTMRDKNIR